MAKNIPVEKEAKTAANDVRKAADVYNEAIVKARAMGLEVYADFEAVGHIDVKFITITARL